MKNYIIVTFILIYILVLVFVGYAILSQKQAVVESEPFEVRCVGIRPVTQVMVYSEPVMVYPMGIDILEKLVYLEARGEPFEGKVEVARVVFNRMASEDFPDTIEGVVFQHRQFSPADMIDGLEIELEYLAEIQKAIEVAYESDGEALYFVNGEIADKDNYSWFSTLEFIERIGNHEFYK